MSILISAKNTFLAPYNLDEAKLSQVLQLSCTSIIDYADLYFEKASEESWSLEDGIVKSGSFSQDLGVGIRAISDTTCGLAYSNVLDIKSLTTAAKAACSIVKAGQSKQTPIFAPVKFEPIYQLNNPLLDFTHRQKVEFLQNIEQQIKELDRRIIRISLNLAASYNEHLLAASDGTFSADLRPMVRFSVHIMVEQNGRRESADYSGGGRFDYHYFLASDRAMQYAKEALRLALLQLEAINAPAGAMPAVLGNAWCGVLLHEAVGHGLEGDFNRKGTSIYSGKIGQKIASNLCTVIDDGTIAGHRGSLNIDDEGTKTQQTCLIENGILQGFMYDKLNARLMNTKSTGNGRRESYRAMPLPRMTNTYLLAGKSKADEIIQSVKKGLYCAGLGGGQVDITNGKFVFEASEAYLIENGKITAPVKGATLIGSGSEVMHNICMLADDFALDNGVGTCGKDGQSVAVGVGQPTLKIAQITVGGTL